MSVRHIWRLMTLVATSTGLAQAPADAHLTSRGPLFIAVTSDGKRVDARNTAALHRRIAVDLNRATMAEALDKVAKLSGLEIDYNASAIANAGRVSLTASSITVAGALTVILLDVGFDVEIIGPERVMLAERHDLAPLQTIAVRQGVLTIGGHVSDAVTHAALDRVLIRIDSVALGAMTDAEGRYAIGGVSPGTYRLTARRLGYIPVTQRVVISGDSARVTRDFALVPSPTRLDEIVTTAVGEQRRYEVGNVISTINADSIAPTAPVTSLTDLLSARAPGVEVVENSGLAGAGEAIRIRGTSSLVLQSDPIIIVDGIRQDNSAGGNTTLQFGYFGGNFEGQWHPTPTRINDLDFTQIESIDILKGPSATTEYGTDAANGVLVITTKRGKSGSPQWSTNIEQTASTIPTDRLADSYWSWGHTTDGSHRAVQCPFYQSYQSIYASLAGTCTVDSVTRSNPLTNARTSEFGTGYREKYGLQVNGGSETVRYFVAGALSNESGIVHVPQVFQPIVSSIISTDGLPRSLLNPNTFQQRSVRGNTTILGSHADFTFNAAYLSTFQQTPDAGNLISFTGYNGQPLDSAHGYGYVGNPAPAYAALGSEQTDRFTGGVTANWRPVTWFTGHATAGVDHGGQQVVNTTYGQVNQVIFSYPNSGAIGTANTTNDIYTVDLRGSARAQLASRLRTTTSLGLQLVDSRVSGTSVSGGSFAGTPSLSQIGSTNYEYTQPIANRQTTLGGYVEEEASVAERLFLIGAMRVDAGSGFGNQINSAVYPKGSVSWLALGSDNGTGNATSIRLRGSYGQSGVQPANGAGLQLWTPTTGLGGVPAYTLSQPGNPVIKPERSEELEGGLDLGLFHHRVDVAFTAYTKTTHDALVNTNLGWTIPYQSYQENIGKVLNDGIEADATAILVQSRALTWSVTLNASWNANKLLALEPGVTDQSVGQLDTGNGQLQFRPGYPLYSFFGVQVGYVDRNHDHIIEPNELIVPMDSSYAGSSAPSREASFSTSVGVLHGALRLNALLDYRGGFKVSNGVAIGQAVNTLTGRAQNDPNAPLWDQARSAAYAQFIADNAFFENGDFLRFRELGLTYSLPDRVARLARLRTLSITGAVRNVFLWSGYSGPDPETTNNGGYNSSTTAGVATYNNDIREDEGTVPLARYFILRINAGF